jgi:hypothetical protein
MKSRDAYALEVQQDIPRSLLHRSDEITCTSINGVTSTIKDRGEIDEDEYVTIKIRRKQLKELRIKGV